MKTYPNIESDIRRYTPNGKPVRIGVTGSGEAVTIHFFDHSQYRYGGRGYFANYAEGGKSVFRSGGYVTTLGKMSDYLLKI